jgi:hypothetical protein
MHKTHSYHVICIYIFIMSYAFAGMKHSPLMMEGAASAVRRINATLVHRNTIQNTEAIPPPPDPTPTDKPAETAAPAQ